MFYVYCDVNKASGKIFYVGSGSMSRIKYFKKRNPYWERYVDKYGDWERFIVYETESREEAYDVELIYIALNWDSKNLTNLIIDSRNHREIAKLGGAKSKTLKLGINGLTSEERSENFRKWFTSISEEDRLHHISKCTSKLDDINSLTLECEHCHVKTTLGNYNRWHGDKCSSVSARKISRCEFCNNYFESGNLGQHKRSCELNPNKTPYVYNDFICNFCNVSISTNNKTQHLRSCLENPNRVLKPNSKYRCDKCDKIILYKQKNKT